MVHSTNDLITARVFLTFLVSMMLVVLVVLVVRRRPSW
jgi:hypothetical protein